jgi:hypothetical protein
VLLAADCSELRLVGEAQGRGKRWCPLKQQALECPPRPLSLRAGGESAWRERT